MGFALFITFLSGAATSLGAALIFAAKKIPISTLAFCMSFSAGVMIYVSFGELLPVSVKEGLPSLGGQNAKLLVMGLFALGAVMAALIDYFIPEHLNSEDKALYEADKKHAAEMEKTGVFMGLAVMLHNLPEGLAVFSTLNADTTLGLSIALAIALHNIPEGLIVALPIYAASGKKFKAFMWATFAGLSEPLGALLGFWLLAGIAHEWVFAVSNSLVAGIMVYISFDELLPMAKEYGQEHYGILGVFSGILFIAVITALLG